MKPTATEIDAVLPQTQCGLCGYGGCLPYAKAMVDGEASINLCPPGGVDTLHALADLLHCDPSPYVAELTEKALPPRVAIIREAECIGCTKCIQACPVDAIIGSAKLMHTVITDACTGCELCIPPCPVDCIDLIPGNPATPAIKNDRREAFLQRNERLKKQKDESKQQTSKIDPKQRLQEALARAATKRSS